MQSVRIELPTIDIEAPNYHYITIIVTRTHKQNVTAEVRPKVRVAVWSVEVELLFVGPKDVFAYASRHEQKLARPTQIVGIVLLGLARERNAFWASRGRRRSSARAELYASRNAIRTKCAAPAPCEDSI